MQIHSVAQERTGPIFLELAGKATTNGIGFDYHFALVETLTKDFLR
jgi:hypothetical protein